MSEPFKAANGPCITCGRPIVVSSWKGKCINCYTAKALERRDAEAKFSESERSGPTQLSMQLDAVCRALEPLDTESRSRVLRAAAVLFAIPGGLGGGR